MQQLLNNIKNGKYRAGTKEQRQLAHGAINRSTAFRQDKVSVDERAVARAAIKEDAKLKLETFREDIENHYGTQNYAKRDAVWCKAWEEGHSAGLYAVVHEYDELVELLVLNGSQQKQKSNIEELLRFALNNLYITAPDGSQDPEDYEFDYCVVCLNSEWDHKKDCGGVKWQQEARMALQ